MAATQKGSSAAFGGSALPRIAGIEESGVTSDINVTPMIDVMLVLLIIFMVVTPLLNAYQATLPKARHLMPEPDKDRVTLGIDVNGKFFLEGQQVPAEKLTAELSRVYSARPDDHLLYLKADRTVGYHVVLDAVEAARQAGIRTIGAISDPVAGAAAAQKKKATAAASEGR